MTRAEALAILNLRAPFTESDVKRAFLGRSRLYHPDRHTGASESERTLLHNEFIRISAARDLLLALSNSSGEDGRSNKSTARTKPSTNHGSSRESTGSAKRPKPSDSTATPLTENQFTLWRDAQAFVMKSSPGEPRPAPRQNPGDAARPRPDKPDLLRSEQAVLVQLQAHLEQVDRGHWYTPVLLPCHLEEREHLGLSVLAGHGLVGVYLCGGTFWGVPLSVRATNGRAWSPGAGASEALMSISKLRQNLGPLSPGGVKRLAAQIVRQPATIRVGERVERRGDAVVPITAMPG